MRHLRFFLLFPLGIQPLHILFEFRLLLWSQKCAHGLARLRAYSVRLRIAVFPDGVNFNLRLPDQRVRLSGLLWRQPDLVSHFGNLFRAPRGIALHRRMRGSRRSMRQVVSKDAARRRSQNKYQHQPDRRFLSHLGVHGRTSLTALSPSSYDAGATEESNTMSPVPLRSVLARSMLRCCKAQPPPNTSSSVLNATSRGASRRTLIHTPSCASSSRSFAAIAAITRAANHGPASSTFIAANALRVSANSSSAARHASQTMACSASSGGSSARQCSALRRIFRPVASASSASSNFRQFPLSRFIR